MTKPNAAIIPKIEHGMENTIAISVVVPVFNEAANLMELHRRLTTTLTALVTGYEIIFIDDGSSDDSLSLLCQLQQQDNHIKVIKLIRNFGQHPAIVAGLHQAKGKAIVLIDADLQNPPEEIATLYERFLTGVDVVYGIRAGRQDTGWRRFGSQFVIRLTEWLLGMHVPSDMISGFRIISEKVVRTLNGLREQQYDTSIMMLWLGFKHLGVEVRHDNRHSGESKYSTWKLIYLTMDMIFGFSDFPLRVASITGSVLALISMLVGAYMAICRILGIIDVEGYTSIFLGITFLAGIQLLFLGIIGEYIARIYRELKGRPYYVIDKIYQSSTENMEMAVFSLKENRI